VISTLLTAILAQQNGGGSITGLLIILVPMGAILYMTIMPQRKAKQKQAALLSKLDVGDEVMTTGGIIGMITFVDDDLYHIEIDNDVVIRIAKSAVSRSLAEPAEPEKSASKPASRSRKGLLAGALNGSNKGDTAADTAADAAGDTADDAAGDAAGDTADSADDSSDDDSSSDAGTSRVDKK